MGCPDELKAAESGTSNLWLAGIIISIIGSCASNGGVNLQKMSIMAELKKPINLQRPYVLQPLWFLGLWGVIVGAIADFGALAFAAQSLLTPVGGFTVVANCWFARICLGERMTRKDALATVFISAGIIMVAVSGDKSESCYTLNELIRLYGEPEFVGYIITVCALITVMYTFHKYGSRVKARYGPWSPQYTRLKRLHMVNYPVLSGVMGAQSVLFAKCTAELIKSAARGRPEELTKFGFYAILASLVFTIGSQLHWLAVGLKHAPALFVIPIFTSFHIIGAIIGGGVYFKELAHLSKSATAVFMAGVMVMMSGIYMLSQRSLGQDKPERLWFLTLAVQFIVRARKAARWRQASQWPNGLHLHSCNCACHWPDGSVPQKAVVLPVDVGLPTIADASAAEEEEDSLGPQSSGSPPRLRPASPRTDKARIAGGSALTSPAVVARPVLGLLDGQVDAPSVMSEAARYELLRSDSQRADTASPSPTLPTTPPGPLLKAHAPASAAKHGFTVAAMLDARRKAADTNNKTVESVVEEGDRAEEPEEPLLPPAPTEDAEGNPLPVMCKHCYCRVTPQTVVAAYRLRARSKPAADALSHGLQQLGASAVDAGEMVAGPTAPGSGSRAGAGALGPMSTHTSGVSSAAWDAALAEVTAQERTTLRHRSGSSLSGSGAVPSAASGALDTERQSMSRVASTHSLSAGATASAASGGGGGVSSTGGAATGAGGASAGGGGASSVGGSNKMPLAAFIPPSYEGAYFRGTGVAPASIYYVGSTSPSYGDRDESGGPLGLDLPLGPLPGLKDIGDGFARLRSGTATGIRFVGSAIGSAVATVAAAASGNAGSSANAAAAVASSAPSEEAAAARNNGSGSSSSSNADGGTAAAAAESTAAGGSGSASITHIFKPVTEIIPKVVTAIPLPVPALPLPAVEGFETLREDRDEDGAQGGGVTATAVPRKISTGDRHSAPGMPSPRSDAGRADAAAAAAAAAAVPAATAVGPAPSPAVPRRIPSATPTATFRNRGATADAATGLMSSFAATDGADDEEEDGSDGGASAGAGGRSASAERARTRPALMRLHSDSAAGGAAARHGGRGTLTHAQTSDGSVGAGPRPRGKSLSPSAGSGGAGGSGAADVARPAYRPRPSHARRRARMQQEQPFPPPGAVVVGAGIEAATVLVSAAIKKLLHNARGGSAAPAAGGAGSGVPSAAASAAAATAVPVAVTATPGNSPAPVPLPAKSVPSGGRGSGAGSANSGSASRAPSALSSPQTTSSPPFKGGAGSGSDSVAVSLPFAHMSPRPVSPPPPSPQSATGPPSGSRKASGAVDTAGNGAAAHVSVDIGISPERRQQPPPS